MIASESSPGADDIDLVSFGVQRYFLQQTILTPPGDTPQTGDLDVTQEVAISAFGPGDTVIDASFVDRAFDISFGAKLTLTGVTIEHGSAKQGVAAHLHGGGIHNHGMLFLEDSTLAFNTVPNGWGGGGLTNAGTGTAVLRNVTILDNSLDSSASNIAFGGGIENGRTLDLFNVTIAGNGALPGHGGGISKASGFFKAGDGRLANRLE